MIFTFTPADPCAGANTTTISVSPSAVPVLGTDTICENGGLFDLNPLRDPLYQNGIWTGTGVRTNRYLNPVGLNGPVSVTFVPSGNCIDTVATIVTVVASGTPMLSRDTICQTSGIYDLSQLLDPLYPTGTWIGPGVNNNQFNPAGRFGNINLIFNSDQPCINQTQTVIRVIDQIAYQNVRINCDGSNQNYTVIFDIVRGDTANYQVTGTGGTLTGTTFTSVPIASGDNYSFSISDGSPCTPLVLSGNFDCNCVTSAGTMQIPPVALTFCAQQTAIVNHNGNQILDGNDLLQFILHTSSIDQPGMILATNSSPQFDFQLGTMDYNVLYYISAIAGNNDGSGNVSLTDSCLSVAPGVPIIFYPEPVASFLTEGIICRGDTFNLQIFFQGKSPFYYELAVNGDPQGVDSTEFGIITIPVTPDTTTTYELLSYRDSFCIGSFLDSVAIVRVREPLQLTPLDTIFYPNGTYAVILNASGGDTASYAMSGNSGVLNGTIFTSDPIPCGDTISVQLADANFCTPANYSGPVECTSTCTSFAGILSPADTIRICPNQSGSFTHTGYIFDDNDTLIYVIDTVRHTEIPAGVFTTQQTTIVNSGNFLSGVRYYVTAFVGDSTATGLVNPMDTCLAFAEGPVLIFLTSPGVQFADELVICQGDSISLNLDFQGRAPFTFTYSVNGTQLSPITTSNASYQLQVPFNTPGQVVVRSVFDLFCATNVNDTVDVTFYEPVEALISDLSCDSTTREFTVTIQIRGGDTMSYQVSGVQGVLTGTTFVSNPIRSDSVFTLYVFDGNSCDSVVLSGTINCNCATNAGSFQLNPSPLSACGNDPVTATHLNNQRLDGDDVLQFVLHDNPGNILGNILAINNQPVFSFQAGMLLGTTYYISAVAGNSLPDGTVDSGDPCRSVSQGIPVIFFPNPGVVYMVEDTVCQNDCISISLTFTGIPPFELNYTTVFGQDTTHDNYQAGNLNGSIVFCNPFTPGVAQFETTSVSSHGCTTDLSNSMAEEITILPTALNEIRETLCGNKSITVNNVVFNQNNPADTFYLDGAAANGCDSVIMVNLTFVPSPSSMLDTTICTGDFIVVNGTRYDATNRTGQEIIALNPFCDSIVNVNLNFFPENRVTLNNTLCEGDQIVVNGNIYNQSRPSGTEILQAANGCDSTVVISLSFHPVQNTNLNNTLCFGETLTVGASTFSAANPSGTVNLSTTNGCDSIVNVNLHFLQDLTNMVADTLCANEQLTIGAEIFNRNRPSGSVILTSANGCDSTINVNLNFRPEVIASLSGDAKICEGDSAILVFNLNSSALVNVRITDDQNQALNLNGLSDGSEVIVRPSVTSTYTLVGVTISGSNCPATLSGAANVEVSNLQINTQLSDYEGFNLSCNGERDGSARLIPLQGILPYQVSWSTGDNGMFLQNLSAGTYIFTITDGAGCSKTDSVTLNEPEGILPEIFANDPNCLTQQPGSISIESVTGGAAPYSIKVENGPYVPMSVIPYTVSNLQPGNFDITIRDANNCEVDSKVTISPILEPEVSLGRDTVIGLGDSILIRASSNIIPTSVGGDPPMFLSCDTCLNTFSRPNQNISYRITITDAAGCTATDDLRIEVLKLRNVFIPSAFSPDDDGINDVFSIFGDDEAVKIRRFQIFDRWGNLVYSSADIPLNDPNIGWDGRYKGKRMNPAVFVFWVEIEFLDGETEIFKGDITLLHSN